MRGYNLYIKWKNIFFQYFYSILKPILTLFNFFLKYLAKTMDAIDVSEWVLRIIGIVSESKRMDIRMS